MNTFPGIAIKANGLTTAPLSRGDCRESISGSGGSQSRVVAPPAVRVLGMETNLSGFKSDDPSIACRYQILPPRPDFEVSAWRSVKTHGATAESVPSVDHHKKVLTARRQGSNPAALTSCELISSRCYGAQGEPATAFRRGLHQSMKHTGWNNLNTSEVISESGRSRRGGNKPLKQFEASGVERLTKALLRDTVKGCKSPAITSGSVLNVLLASASAHGSHRRAGPILKVGPTALAFLLPSVHVRAESCDNSAECNTKPTTGVPAKTKRRGAQHRPPSGAIRRRVGAACRSSTTDPCGGWHQFEASGGVDGHATKLVSKSWKGAEERSESLTGPQPDASVAHAESLSQPRDCEIAATDSIVGINPGPLASSFRATIRYSRPGSSQRMVCASSLPVNVQSEPVNPNSGREGIKATPAVKSEARERTTPVGGDKAPRLADVLRTESNSRGGQMASFTSMRASGVLSSSKTANHQGRGALTLGTGGELYAQTCCALRVGYLARPCL